MRGFGVLKPIEKARSQTYDSQQSLTPASVLDILQDGNKRFINNLKRIVICWNKSTTPNKDNFLSLLF